MNSKPPIEALADSAPPVNTNKKNGEIAAFSFQNKTLFFVFVIFVIITKKNIVQLFVAF